MSQLDVKRRKDLAKVTLVSLGVSLVFLAVIQLLSRFVADHPDDSSGRWLVALTGVALTAAAVLVMHNLHRMDELERKMHTEAMAFAFLCSVLLIAAFTFLRVSGLEGPPVTWLLPVMVSSWVIGLLIALVRYR